MLSWHRSRPAEASRPARSMRYRCGGSGRAAAHAVSGELEKGTGRATCADRDESARPRDSSSGSERRRSSVHTSFVSLGLSNRAIFGGPQDSAGGLVDARAPSQFSMCPSTGRENSNRRWMPAGPSSAGGSFPDPADTDLSRRGALMRSIPRSDADPPNDEPWAAGHPLVLLVRRANALRALEKAEAAEDADSAAEARKQVQEAQLLIRRHGLE
jgi:hypothetical protein